MFIYKIENQINGKIYMGQTVRFNKRKTSHLIELRKNQHKNPHLQNSFNKYGEENFVFSIVCENDNIEIMKVIK